MSHKTTSMSTSMNSLSHVNTFSTSHKSTPMSPQRKLASDQIVITSINKKKKKTHCQLLRTPPSHVNTFSTSHKTTPMSTSMNSHLTCKYIQNITQNYPNVNFYELPPHMLIHSEYYTKLPQCQLIWTPTSHVSTFRIIHKTTPMSTSMNSHLTC